MKTFFKNWLIRNTLPTYRYMSFDDTGDDSSPPKKSDDKTATGYTEDEVAKRVEAARRDEKAKLYEELNGLRKGKDALSEELATFKEQVATLTKAQEDLQKEKDDLVAKNDALVAAQKEDGSVDTEKLIKEITQSIRNEYEENQGKTNAQLKKELAELREAKRQSELHAYRQQRIQEVGGKLISELVRGNSEEEIDKSVEEAQEAYKKYIKANSTSDTGGEGGKPPPPPPNAPSGGSRSSSSPGLDGFTRPNSREAYAKNRENVLADVRKRFN